MRLRRPSSVYGGQVGRQAPNGQDENCWAAGDRVARTELADIPGFLGVLVALGAAVGAQEVAVVLQQFFEAGPGDVGELDLGFVGSAAGAAAFEDVLDARSGSLDHLVVSVAVAVNKAVAEARRSIEDYAGLVEGEEAPVAAVGREHGH